MGFMYLSLSERPLDNVICGVCGVIGQVYYGDGNEKNCCSVQKVLRFTQFLVS